MTPLAYNSWTCHHLEGTSAVLPGRRGDRLFADDGEPRGTRLSFRDDRRMSGNTPMAGPEVTVDVMRVVYRGNH